MLAIVRVRIWLKEPRGKNVIALKAENMDIVWNHVLKNHKKWATEDATILYLTHRSLKEDISLIMEGKDSTAIADFLLKHIAPLKQVRDMRIINLMKPRFLAIPKGTPSGMRRYTIRIVAEPQHHAKIYDAISNLEPTEGNVITYLAYTLDGFGGDLIVSVLSRGGATIRKFVEKHIAPLKGIRETAITLISKTKRLVSLDEWKKRSGEYFIEGRELKAAEFGEFDEDWIASC